MNHPALWTCCRMDRKSITWKSVFGIILGVYYVLYLLILYFRKYILLIVSMKYY